MPFNAYKMKCKRYLASLESTYAMNGLDMNNGSYQIDFGAVQCVAFKKKLRRKDSKVL